MANYTLTQTQKQYYEGSAYGGYQYLSLANIINNFIATYVGDEKILGRTREADVSFHAHRALQELHYDTLKSCKTQEIEICPNLKMPLPQDYINYVKLVRVDSSGIEHIIYPTSKTSNPFAIKQDPDNCTDCDDTSETYEYTGNDLQHQQVETDCVNSSKGTKVSIDSSNSWDNWTSGPTIDNVPWDDHYGQRYGIDPQHAHNNGSYYIDCAAGVIHFSSNLSGETIILKYISDGLGTDDELIVPKLAEEAMYKWIAHGVLSARADVPEYLVARFKKEKYAETRKAKIRLSNIKIEEITQIFRGKAKHIKH